MPSNRSIGALMLSNRLHSGGAGLGGVETTTELGVMLPPEARPPRGGPSDSPPSYAQASKAWGGPAAADGAAGMGSSSGGGGGAGTGAPGAAVPLSSSTGQTDEVGGRGCWGQVLSRGAAGVRIGLGTA